jgi:hypothetical protein
MLFLAKTSSARYEVIKVRMVKFGVRVKVEVEVELFGAALLRSIATSPP